MTKPDHYTLTVPAEYAGERLDQALAKLLPQYSRTQIQNCINDGQVLVNERPAKSKLRVLGGEHISLTITLKEQPAWQAQAIALEIVHEDDSLIIINKPPGLVVHPGAGNQDKTLLNALLHHCPALGELPRAGILHRLDKNTSGLLVVAKTAHALKELSQQLKKREIVREYQAVVNGELISGGMVDAPIDRDPLQRKRMTVSETGKMAITHYRVMEKFRAHTRLRVRLETGRTHQIRVHMAHIRHPILGDIAYGGRPKLAKAMPNELINMIRQFKRQALHAFALGLTHPESGEFVSFEIPLPEDMMILITALREDQEVMK